MSGRWSIAAIVLVLTLLGTQAGLGSTAAATDWTTRGGSPERLQHASESFGLIAGAEAWQMPVDVGASGSQPVFVGDHIYHLAGSYLWQIEPDGTKESLVEGINMVKNASGSWELRPSTSGITFETVDGVPVLYFGTGDNRACAFRLDNRLMNCKELTDRTTAEEPIVTVPLVLKARQNGTEIDIVIMGDKSGNLWAVQGLGTATTPSSIVWTRSYEGGWILASPVPIESGGALSFVWASDRGDQGTVGAYSVVPAGNGQELHFEHLVPAYEPPAGVADGFAKDNDFVYTTDKRGNFLKMKPTARYYKVLDYSASAGPLFANAAPAVDDKHVYFSIRNVGTTQPNQERYPGRLVAVDKESFTVAWTDDLDYPANTNPLVWTAGPNVVLVGDTKGTLYAFDRMTGKHADFMLHVDPVALDEKHLCLPVWKQNLGTVYSAGAPYQTITGVSEPILASGSTGQALLLAGVSGRSAPAADGSTQLVGSLKAFKAGGAYNVSWSNSTLEGGTLELGQTYTFGATLQYDPWVGMPQDPRTMRLQTFWVPSDEARQAGAAERRLAGIPDTITLPPGTPVDVTIPFTPQESDGTSGTLKAVVNAEIVYMDDSQLGAEYRHAMLRAKGTPEETIQHIDDLVANERYLEAINEAGGRYPGNCFGGESELTVTPGALVDNFLRGAFTINTGADLSIKNLNVPAVLACSIGTRAPFSWVVSNPSGLTFTDVPLTATITSAKTGLSWDAYTAPARLPPGDTTFNAGISLVSCPDTLTVRVGVNLGPEPRPVREPTYANNTAQVAPQVEANAPAPDMGGTGGDTRVIIVPEDCQTNPDWSSDQPCLNYPGLRIPR